MFLIILALVGASKIENHKLIKTCTDGQDGCKTCNSDGSSGCDACNEGYYKKEAADGGEATCEACSTISAKCTKCSGASTCTECQDGYYLDGTCKKCGESCNKCEGGADQCTECANGYEKVTTSRADTFTCQKKDTTGCTVNNCKECVESKTNECKTCNDGYYVKDKACEACSDGCKTCTSNTECTVCNDGYFLKGDKTCTKCGDNCKTCKSDSQCGTCVDEYKLNDQGVCEKETVVSYTEAKICVVVETDKKDACDDFKCSKENTKCETIILEKETDLKTKLEEKKGYEKLEIAFNAEPKETLTLPDANLKMILFEIYEKSAGTTTTTTTPTPTLKVVSSKDKSIEELTVKKLSVSFEKNTAKITTLILLSKSKVSGNINAKIVEVPITLVQDLSTGLTTERLIVSGNVESQSTVTFKPDSFVWKLTDKDDGVTITPNADKSYSADNVFLHFTTNQSTTEIIYSLENNTTTILPLTSLFGDVDLNGKPSVDTDENKKASMKLFADESKTQVKFQPKFDESWKGAKVKAVLRFVGQKDEFKLDEENIPSSIKVIQSDNGTIPNDDSIMRPGGEVTTNTDTSTNTDGGRNEEDSTKPTEQRKKGLTGGAIAGIVISCVVVVAGICVSVFFIIIKKKKAPVCAKP